MQHLLGTFIAAFAVFLASTARADVIQHDGVRIDAPAGWARVADPPDPAGLAVEAPAGDARIEVRATSATELSERWKHSKSALSVIADEIVVGKKTIQPRGPSWLTIATGRIDGRPVVLHLAIVKAPDGRVVEIIGVRPSDRYQKLMAATFDRIAPVYLDASTPAWKALPPAATAYVEDLVATIAANDVDGFVKLAPNALDVAGTRWERGRLRAGIGAQTIAAFLGLPAEGGWQILVNRSADRVELWRGDGLGDVTVLVIEPAGKRWHATGTAVLRQRWATHAPLGLEVPIPVGWSTDVRPRELVVNGPGGQQHLVMVLGPPGEVHEAEAAWTGLQRWEGRIVWREIGPRSRFRDPNGFIGGEVSARTAELDGQLVPASVAVLNTPRSVRCVAFGATAQRVLASARGAGRFSSAHEWVAATNELVNVPRAGIEIAVPAGVRVSRFADSLFIYASDRQFLAISHRNAADLEAVWTERSAQLRDDGLPLGARRSVAVGGLSGWSAAASGVRDDRRVTVRALVLRAPAGGAISITATALDDIPPDEMLAMVDTIKPSTHPDRSRYFDPTSYEVGSIAPSGIAYAERLIDAIVSDDRAVFSKLVPSPVVLYTRDGDTQSPGARAIDDAGSIARFLGVPTSGPWHVSLRQSLGNHDYGFSIWRGDPGGRPAHLFIEPIDGAWRLTVRHYPESD